MKGFFYAQSEYSLLNSTIFLNDLVNKSKEYSYSFVALTDDALFAEYKFIELCEKAGIKPILGLRVLMEEDLILLYAYNNTGLKNLINISTIYRIKGLITIDEAKKHSEGLFLVTPGEEGSFEQAFMKNEINECNNIIKKYTSIFKYVYIGLQKQRFPYDLKYDLVKEYVNKIGLKYLPIHKTAFLNIEDIDSFSVIKKIKGEEIEKDFYTEDYLKNMDELDAEFNDLDIYKYVEEVYSQVNIKINHIVNPLIKYPDTKGLSSKEYLKELCYLGLKKRLNRLDNDYENRLNHELDIISKMGYDDYFLLVFDFVRYAKKNNILIGPGRGSAAGSLVSYLLGITNIDPLKYDLLFERFLNPNRISLPDIDIDIQNDKRMDVINYLINKYGKDHVCMISTFDSFKGKSAINDVSRALGIEDYKVKEVMSKCLVSDNDGKLVVTKESIYNAYLAEEIDEYKMVYKVASTIFGLPKTTSTHAAGVILSDASLFNTIPLMEANGYIQSQLEAHDLEDLGLLKMDLLALKNLTMIDKINSSIKLDINNIDLNNAKAYELISSGNTNGIFQLEGRGIRRVLKKFKPTCFSDLVVILALYRPGPMDQIDEYIERKNGKKFDYPNSKLEPILKSTYGIIVYQEQIMRIASDYAHLSMGEADTLRRAISKKNSSTIEEYRKIFISNVSNKEEANLIYDYIVKFADYGFNKSHSVSYAMITYILAYLKANYPSIFITSFLNDAISDIKGSLEYYEELKKNNINILNPDINKSMDYYIVENNNVILPLSIIKSLNKEKISLIIEERKNGNYIDFTDFYKRVKLDNDNYKKLIFSSCFNGVKKDMIRLIDDKTSRIMSDLITGFEYDYSILINEEYDALGFNLNYSLMDNFKELFDKFKCIYLSDSIDINEFNIMVNVTSIKEITTKKNEQMAFVGLKDRFDSFEATIFPSNYKFIMDKLNEKSKLIYNKDILILKIKSSIRNNEVKYEIINAFKC